MTFDTPVQRRFGYYKSDSDTSWTFENFTVEKVSQDEARSFIEEYHYTGGIGNAAMPWGIRQYVTGELIGVIAFHTPISEAVRASVFGEEHTDRVTELHRMAIHPDAPANTGSWFIHRALDCLKEYKQNYWAVISFADSTEGHDGTVYQAASADYTGMTAECVYYRDETDTLRAPRQCGENITKGEARERGWEVVKREAKHRYVFWTPDEYQSKDELRSMCQLEFEPYP